VGIFEPNPSDFFGQAIVLRDTIRAIRGEITADVCQEYPRLVVLSMAGVEQLANEIVDAMQASMLQKNIEENKRTTIDI